MASSLPFFIGALYRIVFYVESPRFLLARGRYKDSRKSLQQMARLNGKNLKDLIPDSVPLEDYLFMKPHIKRSLSESVNSLASIFKRPFLRTTILLSIIYTTTTVAYYSAGVFLPQFLLNVSPFFSNEGPFLTAFVGYLGQVPGIALMAIIIEWPKVGRLNGLRFFSLLTAASFFIFGFVHNEIATSVLMIFIYFSMVPLIPLLLTYMSEVYPTEIRGFASGLFNAISALVGIGVLFASSYMTEISVKLPWVFPTVWGVVYLVQFLLSFILNIETVGKELKDTVK